MRASLPWVVVLGLAAGCSKCHTPPPPPPPPPVIQWAPSEPDREPLAPLHAAVPVAPLELDAGLDAGLEVEVLDAGFDAGAPVLPEVDAGSSELVDAGPATGTLVLTSFPTGAYVTLDGLDAGTTPLTVTVSADQPHHVVFLYAAYMALQQELVVDAGTTLESLGRMFPAFR